MNTEAIAAQLDPDQSYIIFRPSAAVFRDFLTAKEMGKSLPCGCTIEPIEMLEAEGAVILPLPLTLIAAVVALGVPAFFADLHKTVLGFIEAHRNG